MSDDEDEVEEEDELTVDVERIPNFNGFEIFKAFDMKDERERWTLAVKPHANEPLEFGLWFDLSKDPEVTGMLDPEKEVGKAWVPIFREAVEWSEKHGLDDAAREAIVRRIMADHDPAFAEYEERLVFEIGPAQQDDEVGEDDDEDDEAGDDD